MARLGLITYGGLHLVAPRGAPAPPPFANRKAAALFAYLALSSSPQPRDLLAHLLWSHASPDHARHSLRQVLVVIRALVLPYDNQLLRVSTDTVGLERDRLRVDVRAVQRLLRRNSTRALRLATTLADGELLAGCDLKEPQFELWLTIARATARQLAVDAHEQYVRRLIEERHVIAAIHVAMRLVALDPLHEWAHRTLMELYTGEGETGAALRQYEVCAWILDRELGIRPSPETRQLRADILAHRVGNPQGRRPDVGRRPAGRVPVDDDSVID
jgi:DNA-binding SARP family transcriptional activator